MKRLLLSIGMLLAWLAVVAGFACAEETEGAPSGWERYRNDEHGFQIYCPADWEKVYPPGGIVGFRDPEADEFQANAVLVITSFSGIDLEQYVAANRENLPLMIPGVTISDERYIEVQGRQGHEWIIRWTLEGVNFKQKQVAFVAHEKGYSLTCSASEDTYSEYAHTFNEIIDSFVVE